MWRQQPPWANPGSDQSISSEEEKEEELGHDWPPNCVSLAASADKKEGSEILSRLELLKGANEIRNTDLSEKKRRVSIIEDDVEIPNFYDEDDFICPREKGKNLHSKISSSDREKKLVFGAEDQDVSWSSMSKETEVLVHMDKRTFSSHFTRKKSSKGVKSKGKPKFSFRFQSPREGPSSTHDGNNLEINEVFERLDAIEPRPEPCEEIQDEEENIPEVIHCGAEARKYECIEPSKSMAELLDGLQGTSRFQRLNSKKPRGERFPLEDRTVNREVSAYIVDSSESASDSGMGDKDIEFSFPNLKRKTIVDQFQEAFGDTTSIDNRRALHSMSRPPRNGLFWRLQQVMVVEKERETEFLQKRGNEKGPSSKNLDTTSCINVKVLSRHFEAKLTVCRCFVSNNFENLQWLETHNEVENEGSEKTIIFYLRVSGDVDLDVGNCVRIHPPWKEVRVCNDKSVILAAFFSNFQLQSSDVGVHI